MYTNDNSKYPKDGFEGLLKYWQTDILAGLWVFMLSLPLCLGISFASGFPAFSGLITAFIGGILITFTSGAPLTVKGPGISMIAVILFAVENLSPYPSTAIQYTLAIIVLAGLIQLVLGIFNLGSFHSILPESVIYGVITAIAIIISVHQIHFLFGATPLYKDKHIIFLFLEIPKSIYNANSHITSISCISLLVLIFPSILQYEFSRGIPGVFIVLWLGILLSIYFHLPDKYLLNAPSDLSKAFIFPNFSVITSWMSIEYILIIVILGIFESLINTKSIEVLDLYRRKTHPNQELISLGIGNILSGFLGGVPMMVTMIKSSFNIYQGANTRWASFFQSIFLIISTILFLQLFRFIPKATLAIIILYTTYRLNSPKLFKSIKDIGNEQIIIYLFTITITLIFGILAGMLGGLLITFIIYLILGAPLVTLFNTKTQVSKISKHKIKIDIYGAALASNYLSIRKHLYKASKSKRLIIDLSNTKLVDHSFLELIYYFAYLQDLNDGEMELQGLKEHVPLSKHPLSTLKKRKANKLKQYYSNLSERQLDLQAIAAVNNTVLETNLTYDGVVLQGFSFAYGYEIRYRENKFMKFYRNNTLEFSDVFLSKGIRMSEQSHKLSVILVTVLEIPIPDFTLTKEGFVDKVFQSLGYEDIDFVEFPRFSEIFLLNGENKQTIKTFFTKELIKFLEQNSSLSIEAKSNRLLIYRDKHLMNQVELEDVIYFTENLLNIIHQQSTELKLE